MIAIVHLGAQKHSTLRIIKHGIKVFNHTHYSQSINTSEMHSVIYPVGIEILPRYFHPYHNLRKPLS